MTKESLVGRWAVILAVVIVMTATGSGEPETPNPADTRQRLAELAERFRQLALELAMHEIESHANRSARLEEQIGRAVSDRRRTETERARNNSDLLSIAAQLSRSDLQQDERTELEALQNRLLTEASQQLQAEQTRAAERESDLRKQLEREQTLTRQLRRRVATLQSEAGSISAGRPTSLIH